jgi:hypothetical protein
VAARAKPRRFPARLLKAIAEGSYVKVRAGLGDHAFRAIWAVVVGDRVFVRSWSLKPDGWHRTFLKDSRGALLVGGREVAVRAVQTRSERLRDAVSAAYLAKYDSAASLKYAKDLGRARSRATTTELVPR